MSPAADGTHLARGRSVAAAETLGSAVFVGTARDCAQFLPAALERWAALQPLFARSHCIVAENGSTDRTKAVLEAWSSAAANHQVLWLDGVVPGGQSRSRTLAAARNALLDAVRSASALRTADFLVVMDMDEASLAITPGRLRRCMAFEQWDALFANQLFYYDDVWALRDDRRSPGDWVVDVEAAPPGWRRRYARLRYLTWRNRPFWPYLTRPVAVRSAFGGFAIYRMQHALKSSYLGERDGRDICEHVPFNEQMADRGARLIIHPGLINMVPMPLYRLGRALGFA